jgi:hypothetical protein
MIKLAMQAYWIKLGTEKHKGEKPVMSLPSRLPLSHLWNFSNV